MNFSKMVRLALVIQSLGLAHIGASELPKELIEQISKELPTGKVHVSQACELGTQKIKAVALLAETTDQKDPLTPLVATLIQGQWKIWTPSKAADNSRGGVSNFLADFWSPKGFSVPYEIRCTTPNKDPDIRQDANGEFVGSISKAESSRIKHVCFSASKVYNNWVCYSLGSKSKEVVMTFVQLNAD